METIKIFLTNPVSISLIAVFALSFLRFNVALALFLGTVLTGLLSGISLSEILQEFLSGSMNGVSVALNYAFLGVFAATLSEIGFADYLAHRFLGLFRKKESSQAIRLRARVVQVLLLLMAMASQNLLPIHIAFIPIFIPPLLPILNAARVDRRKIACILAFGLVTLYMAFPVGFGAIYLRDIVLKSLSNNGVFWNPSNSEIVRAMLLPSAGMLLGLGIAVFVSFRRPRQYDVSETRKIEQVMPNRKLSLWAFIGGSFAIAVMFALQLYFNSILLGAATGFFLLLLFRILPWRRSEYVVSEGFKMMAGIGMIMIIANGFAQVLSASGRIPSLIQAFLDLTAGQPSWTILLMLLFGWFLTMGIGSSFSTVPILASLYVPMGIALGISPKAIFIMMATSGALGDAGSPVSDTTIGPTSGLNVDGQHDHIRDTVIPTLLHYNIPLLIFGYIAVMMIR